MHFQKARDGVVGFDDKFDTPSKQEKPNQKCRSIFYSFIEKCVSQILKDSDTFSNDQLVRFLKSTQADVHE